MPKSLQFVLCMLLALILLLGLGMLFMPDRYEVVREQTIEAEAATIHPYVEELRRWPDWCAWNSETMPSLVSTFSGSERGVDAVWSWTADEGPGRMVVTASDPAKGVWFDLEFGEADRKMISKGVIQYAPAGEGRTKLTWTNRGELSGLSKLMGPMLDSMMGPDFEAGLASLAELVEAEAAEPVGAASEG